MPPTFYVDLSMLLFPEPVPAGVDLDVVGGLKAMMRKTNEDAPPIRVAPEGQHWRIVDGRHRAMAAMAAGRKAILATV